MTGSPATVPHAQGLPKRVLHVMNGAAGGAALSTEALMTALAARGVSSCAVCADAGSAADKERLTDACEGRVAFFSLYQWNKKVRAAAWKRPPLEVRQMVRTGVACLSALRTARFAEQHGADLVHSNTALTLEGAAAARYLRLPHVWHVRELIGQDAPFRFGLRDAALGRYLSSHASVVVANSHATAARLYGIPAAQLVVVENGFDLARFGARTPRRAAPLVVAMVGNLTSRMKKHELFVRAAARVNRSLDIELRIYGQVVDGDPYVEDVKSTVRREGLEGRLTFAGFVEDPAALMAEIDVLVHPADNESFGRVVVEAWASGAAVVGVDGGGVGSLVTHEHDGLLAAPDDADGLARAIERVAADPALRARLVKAGHATARERFSLDAHAERMLDVYRRALEAPLGKAA